MTNTQMKIIDNYKCLNSLLSKNIANVVINYCPTFYVQHCLKRKRETKIEIGMLQQQLYKKQKFVKQYEEQLKEWCDHINIHSEREWDGHRGHTYYSCIDCGSSLSSGDFGKGYKVVKRSHSY